MRILRTIVSFVPLVERFVQQKCELYNIDASHNLHHSHQVEHLASVIAKRDYHLNTRQKEILYLSSMLHDMCDRKYTPRVQAILDISNFLVKRCYTPMMTHDAVLEIVTSMSYSQIVKPCGSVVYPDWLDEMPEWAEVFHIVREADLLTSYDLKRMVHYKHDKLGFHYPSDIYDDVVQTVERRMSKLLSKGLFVSSSSKKIAQKWHDELCNELLPKLTENDIYPTLERPLEPLPEFKLRVSRILEK